MYAVRTVPCPCVPLNPKCHHTKRSDSGYKKVWVKYVGGSCVGVVRAHATTYRTRAEAESVAVILAAKYEAPGRFAVRWVPEQVVLVS